MADYLSAHLRILLPYDVDVDLRSQRLGLSGRLDRIAPRRIPSLIRTGYAPQDGVWKRDHLMLAGYALMLNEMHQTRISQGLMEYPRSGVVREVQIHSTDRTRVLRIRDRVQHIKDGCSPTGQRMPPARIALHRSAARPGFRWHRSSFNGILARTDMAVNFCRTPSLTLFIFEFFIFKSEL